MRRLICRIGTGWALGISIAWSSCMARLEHATCSILPRAAGRVREGSPAPTIAFDEAGCSPLVFCEREGLGDASICVCVHLHVCACKCLHVHVCVCVCMHVCVSMCVREHVCVSMCVMSMCVCAMCVCEHVCSCILFPGFQGLRCS